jgi:hypothetical protein
LSAAAHCARCSSPFEAGDLRCALCGEVVPAGAERDPPRGEVVSQVLRCTTCDASTRYDPAARGLACAFCGSVTAREEVSDPMEQARGWLPFLAGEAEAQAALRAWLATLGWFRPSDLLAEARVQDLQPLWWVGWVFDAHALVSWTADSNAGAGRSAWAPHSGQARLTFDDLVVSASRGLADKEVSALVESYDLGTCRPAPEGVPLEGATLEQFDVQRSQARARILARIDATAAETIERDHVPGSSVRKVRVRAMLRGFETRRVGFPAWVMAYRYKDQLFRVVLSGQDARCLRGRAPYSLARVLGAIVAACLLVLVALLVVASMR